MPGKNKPKRLDRFRSWRVARRKKRRAILASGGSRNRKPRPKNKGAVVEEVKVPVENKVTPKKAVTPQKAEEILGKVAKNNGKKEE